MGTESLNKSKTFNEMAMSN